MFNIFLLLSFITRGSWNWIKIHKNELSPQQTSPKFLFPHLRKGKFHVPSLPPSPPPPHTHTHTLRLHFTVLISVQRNIMRIKRRDFNQLREVLSFLPPPSSKFCKNLLLCKDLNVINHTYLQNKCLKLYSP